MVPQYDCRRQQLSAMQDHLQDISVRNRDQRMASEVNQAVSRSGVTEDIMGRETIMR